MTSELCVHIWSLVTEKNIGLNSSTNNGITNRAPAETHRDIRNVMATKVWLLRPPQGYHKLWASSSGRW